MDIELPITKFNPHGSKPIFVRKQGRRFSIKKTASIRSITTEIHARPDLDAHSYVKFNFPDEQGRFCNPILTMESDDESVPLAVHRRIALWVGKILHKKYRCQVQVVWSGNKSYHVHFRIKRRNMVKAEVVAIQKCLTAEMERRVRKKFSLPEFYFDGDVATRIELVRLGGGTRVQIERESVKVYQDIVAYLHSDFRDAELNFPMSDAMQNALKTDAPKRARSRAKNKFAALPKPTKKILRAYGKFLKRVGSTVSPSHTGLRGGKERVLICYYGPKDKNPSCVLAHDAYFTTDSRGKKHPVVFSFDDFLTTRENDLRTKIT